MIAPRVISIRPLSKYWTVRWLSVASLYGSCFASVALASGPQTFGVIASPASHCCLNAGVANPVAARIGMCPHPSPTTINPTRISQPFRIPPPFLISIV